MREPDTIQPLIPGDGPKLGDLLPRWLDRRRYWVFGYLAVMYAAGFTFHLQLSPDTAAFLLTGRRLAEGGAFLGQGGYADNIVPGYPYLLAGFFRAFGDDAIPAILLFTLGVGISALVLAYRLFRAVTDRPTAVLLLLVVGINETLYSYAYRAMPDLLFYNGVLLALWGWHRLSTRRVPESELETGPAPQEDRNYVNPSQWPGVVLLVGGVVVMAATRSVVGVVAAAMGVEVARRLVAARRWRAIAILFAAALAAAATLHLAQAGFSAQLTPDEQILKSRLIDQLPQTLHHAATDTGPHLLGEYIAEAMVGLSFTAAIAAPIAVVTLIAGVFLFRVNKLWGILLALFLVQWLLVGTTTRYFMPVIPLLALGWWRMGLYLERRVGHWPGTAVLIVMLVLVPGGSVLKSGDTMLIQRKRPFYEHFNEGKYAPFIPLAETLQDTLPQDALIIAGEHAPAELAFLSRRDVRQHIRHAYDHPGPRFIITPATPNAQAHIDRGDVTLGPPIHTTTDHHGQTLELRPITATRH